MLSPPIIKVWFLLFHRFSLFTVNGSCYNAEAGNKEDCNPKTHHAVVTGLRRTASVNRAFCISITTLRICLTFRISFCVRSKLPEHKKRSNPIFTHIIPDRFSKYTVPKYRFLHFCQRNLQKIFVFIFFFSPKKQNTLVLLWRKGCYG